MLQTMNDEIKFSQDYKVYRTKNENAYPIKESDWERIKRYIRALKPERRIFQIISSVSFGIFGSALLSLIGFFSSENISDAIWNIAWILTSVSLFFGIGFAVLDNMQKNIIAKNSDDILNEMHEIEKSFEKEDM